MPQTFDQEKARKVGGRGVGAREGAYVPRGSTLPVRLAFQDLYMPRQANMVTFKMVYAPSPASPILPIEHPMCSIKHNAMYGC